MPSPFWLVSTLVFIVQIQHMMKVKSKNEDLLQDNARLQDNNARLHTDIAKLQAEVKKLEHVGKSKGIDADLEVSFCPPSLACALHAATPLCHQTCNCRTAVTLLS